MAERQLSKFSIDWSVLMHASMAGKLYKLDLV